MAFLGNSRLKYPVVLVHGLGGRDRFGPVDYFFGLAKTLSNSGNAFYFARVEAFGSIESRAESLSRQIEAQFPHTPVNLLGHSLGGLDSRWVASHCPRLQIASVTTIGTPHRGSPLVDGLLGHSFWRNWKASSSLEQVKPKSMQDFNRNTPDRPGTAYFSATTAIQNPLYRYALPLFWLSHPALKRIEGDNDGFVSVESSKWGEQICVHHGDHYAQIGQLMGRSRGLNTLEFYHQILTHLNKRGF